ncbi:hypothetical protein C8F01DRAFT_1147991 [Mycena amicta]|nr:hypothetical protein C8F01DRAFT_1147991 [Mycena amicta]
MAASIAYEIHGQSQSLLIQEDGSTPQDIPLSSTLSSPFALALFSLATIAFSFTFPMTTTTTTFADAHALAAPDRQRLVRSIRKIRSVLGEEPVVELESTKSKTVGLGPKRPDVAAPSLSAPDEKESRDRPALVLRLPTFEPLANFEPALFSPTTSILSPLSPPPIAEHEQLRLRLAKVSRTLGESVPPTLILTTPAQSQSAVKRRRRASTLIMPESALEQQVFAASGGRMRVDGEPIRRTRGMSVVSFIDMSDTRAQTEETDELTSPLGEVHVHPVLGSTSVDEDGRVDPPPFSRGPSLYRRSASHSRAPSPAPSGPLPPAPTPERSQTIPSRASSPAPSHHHYPARSSSLSTSALRSHSQSRAASPAPPTRERDSAAFAGYGPPPTYDESHSHLPIANATHEYAIPNLNTGGLSGSTHRREEDWTGEWVGAGGNMDDVVRQLRGLRVK